MDEHARLLRKDMEEAGKSSQLGRVEVLAFESSHSSACFMRLWDWHLAPPLWGQTCPSKSAASKLSLQQLTHLDAWARRTCDTWHTSLHMVIGSSSLHFWLCSRYATLVKMELIPLWLLWSVPTPPVFFFRGVIVFHRSQQGFWEVQIFFLQREGYSVGYNEVKQS